MKQKVNIDFMKKTLINKIPFDLPPELERFVAGAKIFDSSCSPEARVCFIDKDGGFYLKRAALGTLEREATMTKYFHSLGLGVEVLDYTRYGECDLMLTASAVGEDCVAAKYLDDPKRLCDTIATELRKLHEVDFTACPVKNRTAEYVATVEQNFRTGNFDTSHFPDSFGFATPEDAWRVFCEGKEQLRADTLIHGDYCLPNVMLDDWRLSCFIDLGNGGVADRHIDIFWGLWTLWFNLKTDAYYTRFLDAYGRDKINTDVLKTVAAAEVFG